MTGHAIVNIAWNSRGWADEPTREDVETSSFSYVAEHGEMHEDHNFDLEAYVQAGWKHGYAFYRGSGAGFSPGGLVFFLSREPQSRGGQSWIVGCYGRVELGEFSLPGASDGRVFTLRCPVERVPPAHLRRPKKASCPRSGPGLTRRLAGPRTPPTLG